MAYPLKTVLAEKLETVVSRGLVNTRPATSTTSICCGRFAARTATSRHCAKR